MFIRRLHQVPFVLALILSNGRGIGAAPGEADLLRAISSVGAEGSGNVVASAAWRELATQPVSAILPILTSLDSANEIAANWLRSAIETIVSRNLARGERLPADALETFLADKSHHPKARRLAYELLAKADPARAEKLLPGFIDDSGSELRRDAVALELQRAAQLLANGNAADAKALYQRLITQARDVDQVDAIAKTLRKMGETVDIAKAFGFITGWKVIGPFDNTAGKGFDTVYPPEQKVDLAGEHDGKSGKVRWRDFTSAHDYGEISMNLPFTHLKAAAAYAYTEFFADKAGPVELRVGSENSFKLWLNGALLFSHDEYHNLKEIDQYPLRAELKPGRNAILVKVLQNEQTDDWADGWDFQLRICDSQGNPIRSSKGGAQ